MRRAAATGTGGTGTATGSAGRTKLNGGRPVAIGEADSGWPLHALNTRRPSANGVRSARNN